METAVVIRGRGKRSCDASLWMNVFIVVLPVVLVIALVALGLWIFTIGGRSRT